MLLPPAHILQKGHPRVGGVPRSPLLSGDSGWGTVVVQGSHVPSPLAPAPLPGSLAVQGACGCQLGGKDQGVTLTLRTTPGASPHANTRSTHGLSTRSPGIRGVLHSLGLILGVFGWGKRGFLLGTGRCTPSLHPITVGAELQPQLCHAEEESSVCFFWGGLRFFGHPWAAWTSAASRGDIPQCSQQAPAASRCSLLS